MLNAYLIWKSKYVFLSALLMDGHGGDDKEIKTRIVKGNKKYATLRPQLKFILVSRNIKIKYTGQFWNQR